jgi:hypothetical protein
MESKPMRNVLSMLIALVCLAATKRVSAADKRDLCNTLIATLRTDRAYKVPAATSPRVEVRLCDVGYGETIQLVAWESASKVPTLQIQTDDLGIVQMLARENIFVVETGGATRDKVYVIAYEHGKPTLAYSRVTRGTAGIHLTGEALELNISGIYAGDQPPRAETRRFVFDASGIIAAKN